MAYEVKTLDDQGNEIEVEVSLADLAGIDMDAVEAQAGGFEVTQKGAYVFRCSDAKLTDIADYPVVSFELEIVECMATSGDKTEEQMVGEKHVENVFIKDVAKDIGRAKFLMQEAGYHGSGSLNDLLDGFVGTKFAAKIKHASAKDDKDKIYANLDVKSIKPVE